MPESAGGESSQSGTKTRLLATGSDAQVDVVAQPLASVDVPVVEIRLGVLRRLHAHRTDVLEPIPRHLASGRINAVETQAAENACAFCHHPDAIVLGTRRDADHVQEEQTAEEVVAHEAVSKERLGRVPGGQPDEEHEPGETSDQLNHGRSATARNPALAPRRRLLRRVDGLGNIEHGGVEPATVLGKVEGGSNHETGEEENISKVVQQRRQLLEPSVLLEVGEMVIRKNTIGHVPAEGAQLHDEHHLRSCDINRAWVIETLAHNVVDAHVAHEEDEADPRHIRRAPEELCDRVCANGRDEDGSEANP